MECLESISVQTYPHFECLLVNDESTDNSGEICQQFCEKDSRFHLLYQEKSGASTARNRGLEEAKGDYVLFIDSDDVLFPNALQIARQEFESGPYDWVMFDYVRAISLDDSISDHSKTKGTIYERLNRDNALLGLLNYSDPIFCAVWNKVYSRRVIGEIRFKDICYFEDFIFNYEVFRRTGQFVRIHQYLYLWRIRKGSLSSINTPDRYLSHFKALLILESISRNDAPSMRGLCLKKLYRQLLIARFHLKGTPKYAEFRTLAKRMKEDSFQEYLLTKSISIFEKLLFLLFWACPNSMKTILKVLGN